MDSGAEPAHSLQIRLPALARDLAHAHRLDDRAAAERLTLADVGEMHLDRGEIDRGNRVAYRVRVMSVGAGVDHDAVGPAPLRVNEVDERPFAIGLKESKLDPLPLRKSPKLTVNL